MALVATNCVGEPRSYSEGPVKVQLLTIAAASGDTTGTITCDRLTSIIHVQITGLVLTAAPVISGNVITLAFADPLATISGTAVVRGK